MDDGKVKIIDGLEIKYRSEVQRRKVEFAFRMESYKTKTIIVNQHKDGSIVIHRFFLNEDVEPSKWLGYAIVIGPRGGKQTHHNYFVFVGKNGDMELCVI